VRRYLPAAERAGLPHRVLPRGVPRERHRHVDGVRAGRVLGDGRHGHVELDGPVGQGGRRGLQVGHQDGHRAAVAVQPGDEHAAAGHAAGPLRVDAPGDPAAGALRRPEREVGGAVRRVVRPVQAGAEHGQVGAPLERPSRLEVGGRTALGCGGGRRRRKQQQQQHHCPEEEPRGIVPTRHLPKAGHLCRGRALPVPVQWRMQL